MLAESFSIGPYSTSCKITLCNRVVSEDGFEGAANKTPNKTTQTAATEHAIMVFFVVFPSAQKIMRSSKVKVCAFQNFHPKEEENAKIRLRQKATEES